MVGFRNIAVHNYQELDLEFLKSILLQRLSDFTNFSKMVLKRGPADDS